MPKQAPYQFGAILPLCKLDRPRRSLQTAPFAFAEFACRRIALMTLCPRPQPTRRLSRALAELSAPLFKYAPRAGAESPRPQWFFKLRNDIHAGLIRSLQGASLL